MYNYGHQAVPVSQLLPVKPAAHVQEYQLNPSVHVPPFWQGLDEHSLMSGDQKSVDEFPVTRPL